MTITELAIKRPIIVIVLFTALALLGGFCYVQMKYELMPNLNMPVVSISTVYPGASASEVESQVTEKIEDAVSGLDKVDTLVSTSAEGLSIVTINFTQNANIDLALQDAQRKVNQIVAELPAGVKSPALSKMSLDDLPIITAGVTGNLPETDFYQFTKRTLAPQLSKIAGVGQVTVLGGGQREIKVNLDTQKTQVYGLSSLQILQAVQNANLEFPTGKFKDSDNQFVVRLAGRFSSLEDLKNLVVAKSPGGGDILLSDVAEIQDGKKDPSVIARINGQNTLVLAIQKQSDANSVEISRRVRQEFQTLNASYRDMNLQFKVILDSSTFTTESANSVKTDLLMAILLVALVMLVFLHSFRNSLIVLVAIPTSLVSTFIGMWAFGFSFNVMSLLALSLSIGILVDDAIVVLENIYRHLEMGKDKQRAALEGRNEIGFTALSITLVDVVVYGPLALTTGLVGSIMRQFALVIVFATLMSLFVSFTVTPLLASRFSKLSQLMEKSLMGKFGSWFEKQYAALTAYYVKILRWSLDHPMRILLGATFLFVMAVALVPAGYIGSEFATQPDMSEIMIGLELPPGAKLEQTNLLAQRVAQIVSRIPEVDTVFSETGLNLDQGSQSNYATQYVLLVPKEQRTRSTDDITSLLKKELAFLPGVIVHLTQPSLMGGGNEAPIQMAVSGSNWDTVAQTAERVRKIIAQIPGTYDVRISSEAGQPELKVQVDRKKLSDLGLSVANVGSTLQVSLAGNTDSKYRDENGNEYDINVILDQFDRTKTEDLGSLTVANNMGQLIPLNQFAAIKPATGPTKLERRDRNYAITVLSEAVGRTSGDIGNDIQKRLDREKFPPGITVAAIGDLKTMSDSFLNLGIAIVAAIIFVYLIMATLYNSFIYPFSVLFSIPLAIIGALLALGLTKSSLSIFSILGLIMLIGLVSKNAILLVDFTNKVREEGAGVKEALIKAGQERLRPILMTTLTMILGMLPMALNPAAGSEFTKSLGWVLIGGLSSSMLMTLVVVPVVYTKVEQVRELFVSFKSKIFRPSRVL